MLIQKFPQPLLFILCHSCLVQFIFHQGTEITFRKPAFLHSAQDEADNGHSLQPWSLPMYMQSECMASSGCMHVHAQEFDKHPSNTCRLQAGSAYIVLLKVH